MTQVSEQHDDHCWLTVGGSAWSIRRIERTRDLWTLHLWRGYEPRLEYAAVEMPAGWEQPYATEAARWLEAGHA